MSTDPESTIARPLLALTNSPPGTSHSTYSRRRRRQRTALACGGVSLLLLFSYAYLGPAAGLPVPDPIAPYAYRPSQPFHGNAPPPSQGHNEHPHGQPPTDNKPPLDTPDSSHPAKIDISHAGDSTTNFLAASSPQSVSAARSRYSLKTSRPPPKGFDAFYDFAKSRGCLIDAYDGVYADFAPFREAEKRKPGWFKERIKAMAEKLKGDSHGVTVLTIRDGAVHQPETQGGYFDGDWERTITKFVHALPPMQVLINGRDEPRVVFDSAELFSTDKHSLPSHVASLSDSNPFGNSPPSTEEFFKPKLACRPPRGSGGLKDVPFLLSASSAEFTTDFVPVLSMTKLADSASGVASGGQPDGGPTCFADIVMPGEFYYRESWWAGKFEHPNNIPWEDKKDVLYWRGKSNGGHIRHSNHKSFPRFRLIDLARQPEVKAKGLLDVRITEWHEWHCTDNCDAESIKSEYNITGHKEPREDAYKFKYLLDIDGNSFSGRYLGLLRSGGLVFKSTAFAEFFTPWLIPYEHFIPVRVDLSDLVEKVEWARNNDAEARRIQEAGRIFAEKILTDDQNDCYWFAVMMEWGALWGE
ncbi:CAP10 domain-containing protein [Mycena indigotica]|uniref:CAP10 domain-containing protein n=1 Tax=Mycena indigotica TaxID=2126181 RepID=A0A8H6WAP9_9AGAR|nr:CAP10 domain-containing protein [Mycena indigotica]KAF7309376.1 CAP10 domain-containing protein [Mycena indigotica]